jgi:ribonuclease HII
MFRRRLGLSLRKYDRCFPGPLLGIDEVGTGAIAGPIYAAGVVLPREGPVLDALEQMGLTDSKKMTPVTRKKAADLILKTPEITTYVVERFPFEIEQQGHYKCIGSAFDEIILAIKRAVEIKTILIDGRSNSNTLSTAQWIEGGDGKSMAIAAASVIAKVARDQHMVDLENDFPEYSFSGHKGYFTLQHQEELKKYGACEAHRKGTQPIKQLTVVRDESLEEEKTS